MQDPTYCHKCGKKLIKSHITGYRTDTGYKIFHMQCPSGLCEHTGISHDYIYPFGLEIIFNGKCKKCGEKEPCYLP